MLKHQKFYYYFKLWINYKSGTDLLYNYPVFSTSYACGPILEFNRF